MPPTCKCDPQPECPPNTKTIKDPAGGCTITCESPSCIEIVEPSADQCPSGGFTPKYGADGCITGYSCVTCPVAGDPSFCANGTVVVPLKKDGTCDYAKLACVPCAPAEPPFPGFCNDGAKVVKKDGKCLGATECSCLDQSACPPDRKTLPIPGSACQLFTCNKVDCPTPSQPSGSCDGNYVWQRDANDCATTALCTPPGN